MRQNSGSNFKIESKTSLKNQKREFFLKKNLKKNRHQPYSIHRAQKKQKNDFGLAIL
jgi:hypothetical protein